MPGTSISTLQVLTNLIPTVTREEGTSFISNLQMKKLRHRSKKQLLKATQLVVCTVRTLTQSYPVVHGHSLS